MGWKNGHAITETLEQYNKKDHIIPDDGRISSSSEQSETYQRKKTYIY